MHCEKGGDSLMKKSYTFGVSTIIIVFTLLCITAVSALTMLLAYSDYHAVQEKAALIQEYYQEP